MKKNSKTILTIVVLLIVLAIWGLGKSSLFPDDSISTSTAVSSSASVGQDGRYSSPEDVAAYLHATGSRPSTSSPKLLPWHWAGIVTRGIYGTLPTISASAATCSVIAKVCCHPPAGASGMNVMSITRADTEDLNELSIRMTV